MFVIYELILINRPNIGEACIVKGIDNKSIQIIDQLQHIESHLIMISAQNQLLIHENVKGTNLDKAQKLTNIIQQFAKPEPPPSTGFLGWNRGIRDDILSGRRDWKSMITQRSFNVAKGNILKQWEIELRHYIFVYVLMIYKMTVNTLVLIWYLLQYNL